MSGRPQLTAFVALLATACAHAPPAPPLPEVSWPDAPARARARLAAIFPDPAAPAPPRSKLRAVLDFVAGVSERDRRREASLERPFGVAVLDDGSLAIADPDLGAVIVISAAGDLARRTCAGREWSAPIAAAVGPDRALWIADAGSGDVVRIGPDGACRAMGAGLLERPTGLVVEAERILVADPPRHQIVALSPEGTLLARWGAPGEGEAQLHFPTALARAADGSILVVDALNFRIARFSAAGAWLGSFGSAGQSAGAFARPKGIAVDGVGRIYVSDAQRDVVLVFGPSGEFEFAISASGSAPGRLIMPAGLAVARGTLYVADSMNRRVQAFEIL